MKPLNLEASYLQDKKHPPPPKTDKLKYAGHKQALRDLYLKCDPQKATDEKIDQLLQK